LNDEKTVEKMKEKEEIREAILSTVKQDDLELDKDQIEAIGEMRKRGIKMFDIASELGIQLPVITKICRQYGWL
jgi:DNA invertase Pin-like site-specific DNA recombinase